MELRVEPGLSAVHPQLYKSSSWGQRRQVNHRPGSGLAPVHGPCGHVLN